MHSGKMNSLAANRDKLAADVLIVGAGLACALRLSHLFPEHNRTSRIAVPGFCLKEESALLMDE